MRNSEFYTMTPIPWDATGYKLRRAAKQVGCTQAEILGCLALLWKWGASGNAGELGELLYADEEDIANVFSPLITDGIDAQKIVQAIVDNGFLVKEGDTYFIDIWPDDMVGKNVRKKEG